MLLDGKAGPRGEVYMMTQGARLLVIFWTGFPSSALWTAFKICDRKQWQESKSVTVVTYIISLTCLFTHVILIWEATSLKLGEDELPVDFNLEAAYKVQKNNFMNSTFNNTWHHIKGKQMVGEGSAICSLLSLAIPLHLPCLPTKPDRSASGNSALTTRASS